LRYLKFNLALALLLVTVAVRATDRVDGAELRLEKVEIFALGPVGYAGATSAGERDYRLLMSNSRERAIQLLNDLYVKGNMQARAYALVGLRKLDLPRFQSLYLALLSSKDAVQVENGCIVSSLKLQDIAREVDERTFPYTK
jgi:hypothetical protein